MYPITVTIQNEQQLKAVMAALSGSLVAAPVVKVEAKAPPAEKPAVAANDAKVQDPAPTAPATAGEVAYEDVAKAVLNVSRAKGRDAAVAVLKPFGIATLKEAKAEQYASIKAAAEAAAQG